MPTALVSEMIDRVVPLADSALVPPMAPRGQLIAAVLVGIGVIIVTITVAKLHPFLSLILGSATVGVIAGLPLIKADSASGTDVVTSFGDGFGSTAASVGTLIALGAMFAKLLADSGGADRIVDTIVGHASPRMLPWAMALVGAVIGLPMFFEIGLVLLIPVIYLVARRAQVSLITVGVPALAGLSAMHGLVPPHPGPLAAIGALKADLGTTLALGLLVAVPTVVVAGPVFGRLAGRWVQVPVPDRFGLGSPDDEGAAFAKQPSFAITLASVLLPVVLMLGKAIVDIAITSETEILRRIFDVLGYPLVALLIAVLVAMFTLGGAAGMGRAKVAAVVSDSLPAIAGIFLIVSAGGGFKQVLVDTGVGTMLADWVKGSNLSVLALAWLLAVLIRLATGSATVATITAAGLMLGVVQGLPQAEVSLVVLAVGSGSVFFSHVNDAGFWLVKEYFGLSVGQTLKSWSVMEAVLSVTGLVLVLILGAIFGYGL